MVNWRFLKSLSLGVLAVTAATLIFPDGIFGIPGINEKVFGFTFSTLLGLSLIFVGWTLNKFANV